MTFAVISMFDLGRVCRAAKEGRPKEELLELIGEVTTIVEPCTADVRTFEDGQWRTVREWREVTG